MCVIIRVRACAVRACIGTDLLSHNDLHPSHVVGIPAQARTHRSHVCELVNALCASLNRYQSTGTRTALLLPARSLSHMSVGSQTLSGQVITDIGPPNARRLSTCCTLATRLLSKHTRSACIHSRTRRSHSRTQLLHTTLQPQAAHACNVNTRARTQLAQHSF